MFEKLQNFVKLIQYHPGMSISLLLHLSVFVLVLVGLPQCQKKSAPEIIISVDLLPISQKTNVENKQATKPENKNDKEKPVDKPKPIEKEAEVQKDKTPVEEPKKAETKPEPDKDAVVLKDKKEEKKPEPKPELKPEPKKEQPKKEEVKKKPSKPKVSEYDALLKTLEETVKKNDKKEKVDKTTKGPSDVGAPLSLSVKDSIKKQIEQCWNPPAGNKDAGKLQILLNIIFNRDGSVANVKIIDTIKYGNDELYKVAADAAVRAVYKCSPLQGLPVDQFNLWKNLEFNFDPSNLIY